MNVCIEEYCALWISTSELLKSLKHVDANALILTPDVCGEVWMKANVCNIGNEFQNQPRRPTSPSNNRTQPVPRSSELQQDASGSEARTESFQALRADGGLGPRRWEPLVL